MNFVFASFNYVSIVSEEERIERVPFFLVHDVSLTLAWKTSRVEVLPPRDRRVQVLAFIDVKRTKVIHDAGISQSFQFEF